MVRILDLFVDELDLAELGFGRASPSRTGRPGYHPDILLKLFIYGYFNRVASSRRLEREAGRNVEVMWLTGRLVPDHQTIADFRRDNGPAIRRTCAQFVELCRRIGTLKGDCVAIDGSTFKAENSEAPNANGPSERAERPQLHQGQDRKPVGPPRSRCRAIHRRDGPDRPPGRRRGTDREGGTSRPSLRACPPGNPAPEGNGQGPGRRARRPDFADRSGCPRHSGLVDYNAQCAVDAETHIIVTHDVTNHGFGRGQLGPMATAARACS